LPMMGSCLLPCVVVSYIQLAFGVYYVLRLCLILNPIA
jgi:hypothetical protein